MTERAVLSHRDVLFVGAVVALFARPHRGQVHEGAAGHDADGDLGLARGTNVHPASEMLVYKK